MTDQYVIDIARNFALEGEPKSVVCCNDGHINCTFRLETERDGRTQRYIIQRINTDIFKDPDRLMENIINLTAFLRRKIIAAGGDPLRETLTVIFTGDGKPYYRAENGECWRTYLCISGASAHQTVDRPGLFYKTAKAFGHFQMQLSDYPADTLYESIPNFHNTVSRLQDFREALAADRAGRAAGVREDIELILSRADKCSYIVDRIASGEFPLRVTHNDTKLNNIMIDDETDEGICVIDFDTIMPGSVLYDFGDSIRFGASSAEEDEPDLSKVCIRMELFEEYLRGFIEGLEGSLTRAELLALPMGAYVITYELVLRFMTDYLNGDTYFRIHREGHNLDRARNQMKLVLDMEAHMDEMNAIVEKYL